MIARHHWCMPPPVPPPMPAPRPLAQRKADALARLETEDDLWVAAADAQGVPYLVPLSFIWDGRTLLMATPEKGLMGRVLAESSSVRVALNKTRDVILIAGTVEAFSRESVPGDAADAFARKLWNARVGATRYGFYRVTPTRIQSWREENELKGRELMKDGQWLI